MKCKCDMCNKETNSLKERKDSETKEPALACEDCWDYSDVYWRYIALNKFPSHKGIMCGDKVWCRINYTDNTEEWIKGIVNNIIVIRAGDLFMYCYYCFLECGVEDGEDNTYVNPFWEEDIWFRNPIDKDELNIETDNDTDCFVLHNKLITIFYEDSI